NYEKAVISYSEGLKKKCNDADLNAVLCTNRAVAQFYLGNGLCSELEFVFGLNPGLLFFTGALCHLELGHFPEAIVWCEEGLRIDSKEKKLLETRNKADRLKRAEQRDSRKAKLVERKEQSQKEALLKALKVLYFEDEEREGTYQVNPEATLLQALQHQRYFVNAGTPAFLVLAKHSPFSKNYFHGKKLHRLK
uniref:Tetratricopeptide repeat domain 4 n=1 Tax=Sphenodon punctatus TaxID=8508 RepID=A0A8D0HDN7_SPHPU